MATKLGETPLSDKIATAEEIKTALSAVTGLVDSSNKTEAQIVAALSTLADTKAAVAKLAIALRALYDKTNA